MISELTNPRQKKKQINLETNTAFDFNQYLVKLEEIMKQYQDRILDSLKTKGSKFFKELTAGLQPIDIVRTFIAVLYLGMSDIIDVEQIEEIDDIKLVIKGR
jgi:chromatin segregation and condensation protein Rec8/ScpA/Scc1 (kleisin family)